MSQYLLRNPWRNSGLNLLGLGNWNFLFVTNDVPGPQSQFTKTESRRPSSLLPSWAESADPPILDRHDEKTRKWECSDHINVRHICKSLNFENLGKTITNKSLWKFLVKSNDSKNWSLTWFAKSWKKLGKLTYVKISWLKNSITSISWSWAKQTLLFLRT